MNKTVREEIFSGRDAFQLGNAEASLRGCRTAFTFGGDDQQMRIGMLSAGYAIIISHNRFLPDRRRTRILALDAAA